MKILNILFLLTFSTETLLAQRSSIGKFVTADSLILSKNSLINIPHPWTRTYLINAALTQATIQRRLFSDNARLDMEAIHQDMNIDNVVYVFLDPNWERIVFAQKNGNWIRSYGDHTGEYQFAGARGMAVDVRDTIYVADTENGRIVKLRYTRSTGMIEFVSTLQVSGVIHPVDIAIDQRGSLSSPPDPALDRIWVADDFAGKLIQIDRGGTVLQEITSYDVAQAAGYQLRRPLKVQTQEIGGRIAFIDGERNAFVVLSVPSPLATAYTAFDPSTSSLSCIGQDINNEWWVGDLTQKMYHKFSEEGEYLASYTGRMSLSGEFDSPVSITKSPYLQNLNTRSPYIFTSDRWGTNTGIRSFFPRSDVVGTRINSTSENYLLDCIITNKSYLKADIVTLQNSTVVFEIFNGAATAGHFQFSIRSTLVEDEDYRLRFRLLPFHNQAYGEHAQEYLIYLLKYSSTNGFTNELPEKIVLYQNFPNPFNAKTLIRFELPEPADVKLEIYDVVGRKIKERVSGYKDAGYYEVDFVPDKLSSGIYIYRLTTGSYTATRKMVLAK